MAEGAFRKLTADAGLTWDVDSAGTAGYHVGEAPDPRAFAAARKHGVDLSGALGRKLSSDDFERFSHIVAMDRANFAGIKARAPRDALDKVSLLLDFVPGREGESVPDPYYGDASDFEKAWDEINMAVSLLVQRLKSSPE